MVSPLRCVLWVLFSLAPCNVHAATPEIDSTVSRDPIEFWVIEPNEGQSAGGHVAIRAGKWVYHVEHRGDGLIADRRTSRAQFEEVYRRRGNRQIEAIPLALDLEQTKRLVRRLESRFFERTRRLDRLDALDSQTRWLEDTLRRGFLEVEIPGLGLYESKSSSCTDLGAAPFARFRREVEARRGRDWLSKRHRDAKRETLAGLLRIIGSVPDGRHAAPQQSPGGALRRLIQSAQTWAAYDVVLECRPVRSSRILAAPGSFNQAGSYAPRAESLTSWRQARDELVVQLNILMASERSDVGLSILLSWARWAALEKSIATGQLHVLDPLAEFSGEENSQQSISKTVPRQWIPGFQKDAHHGWQIARARFDLQDRPLESRIVALELAHHALQHAKALTLHTPIPRRSLSESVSTRYISAEWVLPWPTDIEFRAIAAAHNQSAEAAATLRRSTDHDLRYHLLTRNCVTEMLTELEAVSKVRQILESDQKLGATSSLMKEGSFIPVVAGWQVETSMSAGQRRILASARGEILERIQSREKPPEFSFRESITLTSRTYEPHPGDSSFLLFQDGPIWTRPLFGIANLGYGLGSTALGILTSPVDRGARFQRGVQGMLMSVPELFFFRIRHGSYPITPPLGEPDSAPVLDAKTFAGRNP